MASFEPGQVISGKYRVERVLGQGGMGVVLEATHLDLATRVAIKVLQSSTKLAPDGVNRFLREAQAASKLRSEFVARVSDFGRLDDQQPFMVMELLDGEDFEAILQRGRLPVTEAVDAVLQAAAALAEAHASGIIHRDIKPSNLFVTKRPDGSSCVKVLDFGISKVVDPLASNPITRTGSALGTPLYMSPDQLRSPKNVDARTDVWSLGVVLYEMLAGESPFLADEIGEVMVKILETEPAPLESRRADVPEELAAVVHRCLAKSCEARVASMRELAALLAPFASAEGSLAARRASVVSGGPTPARAAAVAPAPAAEADTLDASSLAGPALAGLVPARGTRESGAGVGAETAASSSEDRPARTRSRTARWTAVAGVALLAGLVGAAAMGRGGGATPASTEAAPAAAPGAPDTPDTPEAPSAARAQASAIEPATEVVPALPSAAPSASVAGKASASTAAGSARPSAPGSAAVRPRSSSAPTATAAPRPSATTLW